MADSIFLKIINRELPAEIVYEDEHCVAIKDVAPKAPVHLLIIPRKVIPRLSDAQPQDLELLGHMMLTAGEVARRIGVEDAFRVIVNNGAEAGQTVFHLHLHLLAGKNFSESQLGF